MLKAYKYRIYPNFNQKILLEKHFGCVRFIYNQFLSERISFYQTTKKGLNYYDNAKSLAEMKKKDDYKWLNEVNSQSLQQSLKHLDTSYKTFFKTKKGFPKFKKKREKQSFNIPQFVKVDLDKELVILPKFKEGIKTIFHKQFEGNVKQATISKTTTKKYYISILVETSQEIPNKKNINNETTIGLDLGIKDFAILSNGTKIENPKYLNKFEKRIKHYNRSFRRKQKGSKNREKNRLKLAKCYEKLVNKRIDFLHKLSIAIIKQYDTICVENLNISGMVRNHKLAKSISNVSWFEFLRQLEYKSLWYGKNLIKIDRFAPSSKTCSVCGYYYKDLKLSEREWTCPECNTKHDRDLNASINIKRIGLELLRAGIPDVKPVEYALVDDRYSNIS